MYSRAKTNMFHVKHNRTYISVQALIVSRETITVGIPY